MRIVISRDKRAELLHRSSAFSHYILSGAFFKKVRQAPLMTRTEHFFRHGGTTRCADHA